MKEKGSGYFSHFGWGHVCDILLIAAAVVLIVGLFVEPPVVGIVGFALFAAGAAGVAARRFVMLARSPKGTPEFRNSLMIAIVMSVVFALSVTGVVLKALFVI